MTDPATHVRYEFRTMMTAQRYWHDAKQTGDEDLEHIALESFLVHYRNLIDFLTGHEGGSGDILPRDLGVGPAYRFTGAETLKRAINKRLSHLTDVRMTSNAEWDAGALLERLSWPWSAFVRDAAAAGVSMPSLPSSIPLSGEIVTTTSGSYPVISTTYIYPERE